MKLTNSLLFSLACAFILATVLAARLATAQHEIVDARAEIVSMSQARDKAVLENIQNIKRINRCVAQTDASGIDPYGNLIYDRTFEAAREAKLKIKP